MVCVQDGGQRRGGARADAWCLSAPPSACAPCMSDRAVWRSDFVAELLLLLLLCIAVPRCRSFCRESSVSRCWRAR